MGVHVICPHDQIKKIYIVVLAKLDIRFSQFVQHGNCSDGMQTWEDVKTESHVFACPRYI